MGIMNHGSLETIRFSIFCQYMFPCFVFLTELPIFTREHAMGNKIFYGDGVTIKENILKTAYCANIDIQNKIRRSRVITLLSITLTTTGRFEMSREMGNTQGPAEGRLTLIPD